MFVYRISTLSGRYAVDESRLSNRAWHKKEICRKKVENKPPTTNIFTFRLFLANKGTRTVLSVEACITSHERLFGSKKRKATPVIKKSQPDPRRPCGWIFQMHIHLPRLAREQNFIRDKFVVVWLVNWRVLSVN